MRRVIQETQDTLQELARSRYERVVYLGSGPFQSLAREATLKLGELTNGAVATCFDSPLGFPPWPEDLHQRPHAGHGVRVQRSADPQVRSRPAR